MIKIAIISGDGQLPLLVGKNLISKKFDVIFIGIKDFADPSLYKKYDYSEISITSFSKILKKLQKEKVDEIIMVGKITRPNIRDIESARIMTLKKERASTRPGDSLCVFYFSAADNNAEGLLPACG